MERVSAVSSDSGSCSSVSRTEAFGPGQWATPRTWLPPVVAIAVGSFLLRLVFSGMVWPVPLVEDEARYWDWSRYPDWSYHTKGPLVAWLIDLSTALVGETELGVRLPAYLCAGGSVFFSGVAGAMMSRGHRLVAIWSAIGFEAILGTQFSGFVMTIDAPMLTCWTGSFAMALWAWRRLEQGRSPIGPAIAFGVLVALGLLAKFTIGLAALGMLLAFSGVRARRNPQRDGADRPGFRAGAALSAAIGISLLGLVPVVIWNSQHDWATFRHVLGHLDLGEGSERRSWSPMWTVGYFGLVIGVAGPFAGLSLAAGVLRWWRSPNPVVWISLGAAAPVFVVYLVASFSTEIEGNWIVGGYVPLIPLGAEWLLRGCSSHRRWILPALRFRFLVTTVLLLSAPLLARAVPVVGGLFGQDWGSPLRRVESNQSFAVEVEMLVRDRFGEQAATIPVVANYYSRTALLAFYGAGKPQVRCASNAISLRSSSYDDFPHRALPDSTIEGQRVVLVGGEARLWRGTFALREFELLGFARQRDRDRPVYTAIYSGMLD